jgi:AcrR family transcriptional regulator
MSSKVRTRLSREDRMEQTLDAAHAMFAEHGYAAVTMEEIAASVGVTKPLIYNYFGNKERLYIRCMERSGDALLETVTRAVAEADSPSDGFGAGVHAFFSFLDTDRAAWAVLFDETLPQGGEVMERVSHYRNLLLGFVSETTLARMSETTRESERVRIEVEVMSTAMLGAAEAVARWWLTTESISASEAAELLISTVEPGLRLRSATNSTKQ